MPLLRDINAGKKLYHNTGKVLGAVFVPKSKAGFYGRLAGTAAGLGALGVHRNTERMYDNAGVDPAMPMQTEAQMADDIAGGRSSAFLANAISSASASAAERAKIAAQQAAAKQLQNNKGHASHFSRKYTPPTM